MNIQAFAVLVVASAIGLAACSQNTPPADNLPVQSAPAVAASSPAPNTAADAEVATADADVVLTVEPGFVTTCEGGDRTTSVVKWQVNKPNVASVKVEVSSAAEPQRQTFAMGGAVGEAMTGNWVGDGVQFHLSDAATGDPLANYTVTLKPCALPSP